MTSTGKAAARKLLHARILLKADVSETHVPIKAEPGQVERYDYELVGVALVGESSTICAPKDVSSSTNLAL